MTGKPQIFGMPPGADFPLHLVAGLRQRMAGQSPEAMARVELIVNTARMRRRVTELFVAAGAGLLPRLRLLTDLGSDTYLPGVPAAVPPLRRRLELSVLIARLLDKAPDLAPRAALYDLADSLAALMDEMRGEGVTPDAITQLDVSEHSDHWQRTQAFMSIVAPYFAAGSPPDAEARQRLVVEALIAQWQSNPPTHPVILAGSTGSRGTTALLMQAVALLPQGMLVLPGFDFDLAETGWSALEDDLTAEDHPQYRFHRLLQNIGLSPQDVQLWDGAKAPAPARNRLISLSLQPAPVTDQWRALGPGLPDLGDATRDMTLIEAPSPRAEALAIALILRGAVDNNIRAALVTPDRGLTRQVTAALDRWGIVPDDSAGRPLGLSAPGRFLRHVAHLFGQRLTGEALLTLLKHPLTASGGDRGNHLRLTRELELWLRRNAAPFPDDRVLRQWSDASRDPAATGWANWLIACLSGLETAIHLPLAEHVARHLGLATALAQGDGGVHPGKLWDDTAGEMALAQMASLQAEAEHGGVLGPAEYRALFDAVISRGEVRDDIAVHSGVMIWGTLEARVQGADLVILGGLNDGIWPQLPPPDPWMNRRMRKDAGLLLPDRRIGLSAHDYQQAVAAPRVVLTRATRDAEAETVASRWINRLTNLMGGLPERGGPQALADMRARGKTWLRWAEALDQPEELTRPEPRPAPCPPAAVRPRALPVTAISRLIRDPYEIYAKYILRLRKLNPLHPAPDARLRGEVLHVVLENFERARTSGNPQPLVRVADSVLQNLVPWEVARLFWQARLDKVEGFVTDFDSREGGVPAFMEKRGEVRLAPLEFTLNGRPDRIDVLPDGRVHIIDYKTGSPPSAKEQKLFDKQLLLLAAMAERGAFEQIGAVEVARVSYLGLGPNPRVVGIETDAALLGGVWEGLHRLVSSYLSDTMGFTARRALQTTRAETDYDHLSRFGEWDLTQMPTILQVGR